MNDVLARINKVVWNPLFRQFYIPSDNRAKPHENVTRAVEALVARGLVKRDGNTLTITDVGRQLGRDMFHE